MPDHFRFQADWTDRAALGRQLHALVARLYPICRSITGPGVRQTLAIVQEHLPLEVRELPTGLPVFDWQIPREWRVRDAYVKDATGRRVIDFQASNLHLVSYSVPVRATLSRDELLPYLHTLPERPQCVPYRTSYYRENWGFCLSHAALEQLGPGPFEVLVDSELVEGSLTYGELFLPGQTSDEVLFSCHVCHPSLCNDNLSGIAVATALACRLAEMPRRYSYRFLFAPGTIGAIAWLSQNAHRLAQIKHGLVLALLGDAGTSTYKRSRHGNAEIDRAAIEVLRHAGQPYEVRDFSPIGYDERQYGSPGINLPVGCLMRTPPDRLPEYHTSADNLDLVRPEALADSWAKCLAIVDVLERNRRYRNLNPCCEPQLGRRGLYSQLGGKPTAELDRALLWTLNLSDGEHALLDIAERSALPFALICRAADALARCGLLAPAEEAPA